jgi:hypothetical protein
MSLATYLLQIYGYNLAIYVDILRHWARRDALSCLLLIFEELNRGMTSRATREKRRKDSYWLVDY